MHTKKREGMALKKSYVINGCLRGEYITRFFKIVCAHYIILLYNKFSFNAILPRKSGKFSDENQNTKQDYDFFIL